MHDRRRDATDVRLQLEAPLDRVVFYPVATAVFRAIRRWPITANQVSVLHLCTGVSTFLWLAAPEGPHAVFAFCFYMLRNMLDCLDGVVAREKKLVSVRGKILDEWSDACSTVALVSGVGVAAWRTWPSPWLPVLSALALGVAAVSALQYELFRRRIITAVEHGRDCVGTDYEHARQLRFSGIGPWLGYLAEAAKVRLANTDPASTALEIEARWLQSDAGSPAQRRVVRLIRLGSGENPVLVLLAGVLLHQYVSGLVAMAIYGLTFSVLTNVVMTRYLARGHR